MDSAESHGPSKSVHVSNPSEWSRILHSQHRPLIVHINADTTWLIQLPYPKTVTPPCGRTHFNVLLDPWLQGPQIDVAGWFSTQWHVIPPSVATIAELNLVLQEVERAERSDAEGSGSFIDAVAVSHEFSDHCHKATLLELPKDTPAYAADAAAKLIRGWNHFSTIINLPVLGEGVHWSKLSVGPFPRWIAVGRVTTPKDQLYFHSAILITFDLAYREGNQHSNAEAVVYSPHGISNESLGNLHASQIDTLALLHGLNDIRLWKVKQFNLGALNGIRAAEDTRARYWIATHDEPKTGRGIIAPLLRWTTYSLKEAIEHEQGSMNKSDKIPTYQFVQLGSGDGLVLD